MGENEYKISLGVQVETDDIKSQLNIAEAKLDPIKIKVDAETKELTNTIKDALKSLTSGTKNALTLDTTKIEGSLKDVATNIKDIKTSIGTLDSKSGMKSLLSSINQISTALEKASNQFESLNAELKTLSANDFSINLGVNMGGSNPIGRNAAYGSKVRNETLPQLKQQMSDLVKYYNTTYKESLNEFEALQKLVSGTKLNNGDFFETFLFGKDSVATRMSGSSLSGQMQAYKQYIDMFKQAASLKGLDISSVTSGFSKSADDLIKDAQDIQTGAKEAQDGFEKLKQVFGSSGDLNLEGLSTQLQPIVNDLKAIREAIEGLSKGISIDGLTQSFDRLSESIEKIISNAGNFKNALDGVTSRTSGSSNAVQGFKEIDAAIDNAENKAKGLENALKKMGVSDNNISKIVNQVDELGVSAQKVTGAFNNDGSFSVKVTGIKEVNDELEQTVVLMQKFNTDGSVGNFTKTITEDFKKASVEFEKLKATADSISSDASMAKVGKQFTNIQSSFDALAAKTQPIESSFDSLKSAYSELTSAQQSYKTIMSNSEATDEQKIDAMNRLVNANKEYQNVLETTNNLVAQQAKVERGDNAAEKLELQKQQLSLQMNNWLKNNSSAAKEFGGEIQKLQARLNSCDSVQFDGIKREFDIVKQKAIEAGKTGQTFVDGLKSQFSKYTQYFSVASLFMYAQQGLRSMFEQVKLIDSAMTELKKVTNETDASYNQFLTNAASRAKEIGTTIDGLVSSTADFARLGYEFADAQGLAEVANIYAVVGDDIDSVETATQSLISTLTAFKDEMGDMDNSEFALSIVDKMNEVANNYAISSGGIGDALQRSASSMMAANNSLDETIALITAANTVVQDPDSVGTAFKTISMRIKIHCPQ